MANRFWVGGTDNWNNTAGTKWATTSGGAGGAAVPTAADDVFFDANSGSVTVTVITANPAFHSLDCTGFTGTLANSGTRTWVTGGGATDTSAAVFTLGSGMTFAGGGTLTITCDNRSGGYTLTTNGVTMSGVTTVNSSTNVNTQGITLSGNATITGANLNHTRGTVDVGSNTLTMGSYSSSTNNAHTLSYNGGTIVLTTGAGWTHTGTSNFTLTENSSSTLTLSGSASVFSAAQNLTFNGTVEQTGAGICSISGAGSKTFFNYNRTGTTSTYCGLTLDSAITISTNGTLTLAGDSQANRLLVCSDTYGTQRSIACDNPTTKNVSNCDFRDLTFGGATTLSSATSLGDCGGNNTSTITAFTTPVTRYWVADSGNFSDTNMWSTSSGGSTGASMPIPQDTAIFDANSFTTTNRSITINVPSLPALDASAVNQANTNILYQIANLTALDTGPCYYGNVTLNSNMQIGFVNTVLTIMAKRGTQTWTQGGANLTPNTNNTFLIKNIGGTFQPQDDFSWQNSAGNNGCSIQLIHGTFNPLGNVTATVLIDVGTDTKAFTGTSGKTITLNNTIGTTLNLSAGGGGTTVTPNTMSVAITNTGGGAKTVQGSGATWGDLTITTGGTGAINVQGNNTTWRSMNVTGGTTKTITFASGQTTILTNPTFFQGATSNLITINASSGGSAFTLSCASTVSTDYISLQDSTASGGTPFYAGANSTNVSGNTNWTFTGPPGTAYPVAMPLMGVG